jgi:hypothetical protein
MEHHSIVVQDCKISGLLGVTGILVATSGGRDQWRGG